MKPSDLEKYSEHEILWNLYRKSVPLNECTTPEGFERWKRIRETPAVQHMLANREAYRNRKTKNED